MIIIDLDNNIDKAIDFKKNIDKIFDMSSKIVHLKLDRPESLYRKFTIASIILDSYLERKTNFYNLNSEKEDINVIYVWNNYSIENTYALAQYKNVFVSNLVVFQKGSMEPDQSWIFGNIIAMLKWSTSAFRFKVSDFENNWLYDVMNDADNKLLLPVWYCQRIGLDVKAVI
jgi:hypothetical protein